MSRRCVFLDRDGVINEKPRDGEYIRDWSEFRLLPRVIDWIRLFNALGFLVIVVTNQRGVARGVMSAADVEEIHSRMTAELARHGARVDDVFCCPHEENTCNCRKPRPGLVLQAQDKWDVDLAHSLLIGDSDRDAALAVGCGIPFLRAENGRLV
ncbi:MAG TPA: HAD family hydrolase [Bryobacteraceae bacterium]|nr:HAD family hydrolase [Bryobacteraceae bacterium]